ncbi:MAG: hypothetical protein NTY53_20525 [Kiritimatiellaeota bacterium]|nr:hypothetical protein [Kiritimatiellota bacterium]
MAGVINFGDLYRLAGKNPQAVEQYQAAQQLTPDNSQGRKLPTQLGVLDDDQRRGESRRPPRSWPTCQTTMNLS